MEIETVITGNTMTEVGTSRLLCWQWSSSSHDCPLEIAEMNVWSGVLFCIVMHYIIYYPVCRRYFSERIYLLTYPLCNVFPVTYFSQIMSLYLYSVSSLPCSIIIPSLSENARETNSNLLLLYFFRRTLFSHIRLVTLPVAHFRLFLTGQCQLAHLKKQRYAVLQVYTLFIVTNLQVKVNTSISAPELGTLLLFFDCQLQMDLSRTMLAMTQVRHAVPEESVIRGGC